MRITKSQFYLKHLITQLTLIALIVMGLITSLWCETPVKALEHHKTDSILENKSSKKSHSASKKQNRDDNDDEDDDDDDDEYNDDDDDGIDDDTDKKTKNKKEDDDPLNKVEPFPFIWVKPAPATLGANNAHETAAITNSASFTVTGYFSPTCGHCGYFFKAELPDIKAKYINPGKIKLGIRAFCHHPVDFIVAQLAWSRGAEQFLELFSTFMENQEVWFELILIPMNEKEKRKKVIDAMLEKLPATIDRKKALVQLNINEENPTSSVILFALSKGFSIDEINTAVNSPKAEEITNQLIVTVLEAKDDEGKAIPAIPTYYINGAYQKEPLNLADFESLVKTGNIVPRPKETTQTTIPTATPTHPAAQAFASIAPQQPH
jgi:hypothetical protein